MYPFVTTIALYGISAYYFITYWAGVNLGARIGFNVHGSELECWSMCRVHAPGIQKIDCRGQIRKKITDI